MQRSKRILMKNNPVDYFVLILLIFKSIEVTFLAITPVTTVLFLVLVAYIFNKRALKVDKFFYNFSLVYFVILLIYLIQFGEVDFFLSCYIYLKFLYAYLSVKIIGEKFFIYFEDIVYKGALISLPLFALQIFFYDQTLYVVSFLQKNISFFAYNNDDHYSMFIFSIQTRGGEFRNSGFAWEPKGFSNFLALAILINLVRYNFKLLNKKLIVLVVALITTFSTTGYLMVFLCFSVFYFLNINIKHRLFVIPIIFMIFIFVVQQDFIFRKINYEFSTKGGYEHVLNTERDDRETFSLGRIGSFIVDYEDFKKKPIFGYGMQRSQRTQHPWVKLVRVNGLSDIFATFGSLGLLFFLYTYWKFYDKLLKPKRMRGRYVLMMSTLICFFASNLISHPFWMSIYFVFLIPFEKRV